MAHLTAAELEDRPERERERESNGVASELAYKNHSYSGIVKASSLLLTNHDCSPCGRYHGVTWADLIPSVATSHLPASSLHRHKRLVQQGWHWRRRRGHFRLGHLLLGSSSSFFLCLWSLIQVYRKSWPDSSSQSSPFWSGTARHG